MLQMIPGNSCQGDLRHYSDSHPSDFYPSSLLPPAAAAGAEGTHSPLVPAAWHSRWTGPSPV